MSARFLPEKIRDFLLQRAGRRYCDTCIQERLGLRWRQQVQLVTATLAVTRSFARDRGICCTCNEEKQVTEAVRASADQAPPSSSAEDPVFPETPPLNVKLVLVHR
jgi:hypothetical protein